MSVIVEFQPEEAAAILERLRAADGSCWVDSDPDLISGASRLERALKIERGSGGNAQETPESADVAA
jgi:hypothetical protein